MNSYIETSERSVCNFSAGPAALPLEVLNTIHSELYNFKNTGVSIMELSHRTTEFLDLIQESEKDLRELLNITDNYKVLFLQGGARGQFAGIPLNLKGKKKSADYVDSGHWSKVAISEASKYLNTNIVTDGKNTEYHSIPNQEHWQLDKNAAYLHYTSNETIGGLEFPYIPNSNNIPLISDMSSNLLSRPIDIKKFGVIYACAQKNMGISGVTIVIIREDLLHMNSLECPSILNYSIQDKNQSLYNTPPIFAWYVSSLLFKWLLQKGGLEKMDILSEQKSRMLYSCIDQSELYINHIDHSWRSRINIPFTLANKQEELFIKEAYNNGLCFLKGHSTSGGIRVSLYNATPISYVEKLVNFMKNFEEEHH